MQFQVPQFIEVEDKVLGPFSGKQFIYMAGGIGAFVVLWQVLGNFIFGLILGAPFLALGFALAFYKINNRPFIHVVEAAVKYFTSSRLYIWKKQDKKPIAKGNEEVEEPDLFVPKLSDSKLKDLAWSLDIQESDSIYSNQNQR